MDAWSVFREDSPPRPSIRLPFAGARGCIPVDKSLETREGMGKLGRPSRPYKAPARELPLEWNLQGIEEAVDLQGAG